jgi:hypothetical protein
VGLVAGFGLVVPSAFCGSCTDQPATTGRQRVTLQTTLSAQPEDGRFVNAFGFSIELERVLVSVGPLYYHEGAPLAGYHEPPRREQRWFAPWFGVRAAHAHPGHYVEGETLGEMLTPTSVDLLLGPHQLAAAQGVTGTIRSGSFSFGEPPLGPLSDQLGAQVVLVEGIATSETTSLGFRATAVEDDVLNTQGEPVIIGCAFADGAVNRDGTVAVTVDVALWLDQVDFGQVAPEADGARVDWAVGSPSHNAFVRGLKKAAAYWFRYLPQSA